MMKVIRAEHLGMCFGVRDAIMMAREGQRIRPMTILGDLVHNASVLDGLRREGVRMAERLEEVGTSTVMITAHGASERRRREVWEAGHEVVEATCPLVKYAHDRLKDLVGGGYFPVIVGRCNHVEVRGMTEDLEDYAVILEEADVERIGARDRFGVVAQTTQPEYRVRHLVECLRRRFPAADICYLDTVCRPTKQRQEAANLLARECDAVVVVGGMTSNNTGELVKTCAQYGARVFRVQSANELRPEWFRRNMTVGLTAGTSTPDGIIDAVEAWLRRLAEEFAETKCSARDRQLISSQKS